MPNIKWRKIILLVIVILFVLYNVVWSAFVTFRFESFRKSLGSDLNIGLDKGLGLGVSSIQKDEYTYRVFKPAYLTFTGNLSISENMTVYVNDQPKETYYNVGITIWPRGIKDYEIAVQIIEFVPASSGGVSFPMKLDENMNLLDDTPENRRLYEENLDKIENLYHLAYEMWGILELE